MPVTRRQFCHVSVAFSTLALLPHLPARAQGAVRVVELTPEIPAGSPAVNNPYGIVPGPDGDLVFCEVDTGRTRRLRGNGLRLEEIAGTGEKAYAGDGLSAALASFSAPHELCFDAAGNLYVVERDAHVVRRIEVGSGVVSTFAGTGEAGYSGDGGAAARAQLRQPHSIAIDADGYLLICDIGNQRVRQVQLSTGVISTFGGTGEREATPEEGPLLDSPLRGPRSIATDRQGNAYLVLREGNAVFRLTRATGRLQRVAGTGESGYSGDGGDALAARFNGPKGIAYSEQDHSLAIVDTENHVIRRVDLSSGIISTVLGTGAPGRGEAGDPLRCALLRPHGVCQHQGSLYVTDSENHRILRLDGLSG